jgi:hypothetical protein
VMNNSKHGGLSMVNIRNMTLIVNKTEHYIDWNIIRA